MAWMCTPEAKFLKGRSVWTNWDVEELKAMAPEIEKGKFSLSLEGVLWPPSQ